MTRRRPGTDRAEQFSRQAAQLCALVAGHARLPLRRFLHKVHQLLPAIYSAALRLPDLACGDEAPHPHYPVAEWRRLYKSLDARLGHRLRYAVVFDSYDRKDARAIPGNLADDLAEIHADLSGGLILWRAGERSDAVWYWRFMREAHWGEHATSAIRALYWLHRNVGYGPVPAMPNPRVRRTRSRVTPLAQKRKRRG